MKFDIKIPEWAKWMAQDKNGEWWVYELEPREGTTCWDSSEDGGDWDPIAKEAPPENWRNELYEIYWE